MKKITKRTLKKWGACEEGYEVFCELSPKGDHLQEASRKLIEYGKPNWSNWLWSRCKRDNDYVEQTSVIVGDYGTASAGYRGTASAGYRGTASAGDWGNASAGAYGTALAGDKGTASAGNCGTASAGNFGTISILYCCQKDGICKRKSGTIGENGLKPNVFYRVENGEFKEVEK